MTGSVALWERKAIVQYQRGESNRNVMNGQINVMKCIEEKNEMRITKKKLTDDPVLLRIQDLLKEKGRTEKDMVVYLGIGNGAFTHWRSMKVNFHDRLCRSSGMTTNMKIRNHSGSISDLWLNTWG